MSLRAMAAVWELEGVDPSLKLLLLAIADHADAGGRAWPSYPRLAARVGVSERTVRRLMADAEAGGFLVRVRGGGAGRTTRYTLTVRNGDVGVPDNGDTGVPDNGDVGDQKRGRGRPKTGTWASPEPSGTVRESPEGSNERIETAEALRRARDAIDPRIFGTRPPGGDPGTVAPARMAGVSHLRQSEVGTGIP